MAHLAITKEEEALLLGEEDEDQITRQFGHITWFGELCNTFIWMVLILGFCGALWAIIFLSERYGKFGQTFESQWERTYINTMSSRSCRATLQRVGTTSKFAATSGSMDSLNDIKSIFYSQFGDTVRYETKTYRVLAPTQGKNSISIVNNEMNSTVNLALFDGFILQDNQTWVNGQYSSWAPFSGRATLVDQDLVYVNYGSASDFDRVASLGVTVVGKIMLVRYGREHSGLVAQRAQNAQTNGVIFYSDPMDNGRFLGPVYPEGVYRPESSIRRSNVGFYQNSYPGDPSTPGTPSFNTTVRRLPRDQVKNIPNPNFVIVPVSGNEATRLFESIRGVEAPNTWVGGLPTTYRVGGVSSPEKLSMDVDHPVELRDIQNLFVTVKGKQDKNVILGVKRDAVIFGGSTGLHVMIEIARGASVMMKKGWKPSTKLIFALWDASEIGLMGATEYCEEVSSLENTLAYFDLDGLHGNEMKFGGSFQFASLIKSNIEKIAAIKAFGAFPYSAVDSTKLMGSMNMESNAVPFAHYLGVPTVSGSFSGPYGTKGSLYDGIYWSNTVVDTNSTLCKSLAGFFGLTALKVANDEFSPANLTDHSISIQNRFLELYYSNDFLNYTRQLNAETGIQFFSRIQTWNSTLNTYNSITKGNAKFTNAELNVDRFFVDRFGLYYNQWYKNILSGPLKQGGTAFFPAVVSAMKEVNHDQVLFALDQVVSALQLIVRLLKK
jgi:hypothetical protein